MNRLLRIRIAVLLTLAGGLAAPAFAQSDGTLKVAISLLDIPRLWGAPEGGFEVVARLPITAVETGG